MTTSDKRVLVITPEQEVGSLVYQVSERYSIQLAIVKEKSGVLSVYAETHIKNGVGDEAMDEIVDAVANRLRKRNE